MSLSETFTQAYYFFRNHIKQLAIITMPLLFVQVALQFWLGNEVRGMDLDNPHFGASHIFAIMLLLVIFSWLISALTIFMQWRSEGHKPSVTQVWLNALHFVPALLLAGVFSGLAIIGPTLILAMLGPLWIAGLVLSLYIFARLAYVNFMLITEQLTPLESIKRSFKFSGPLVFSTLVVLMLYIPLSVIGGGISALAQNLGLPAQVLVETFISFIGLFVNVALFRLYMVNRSSEQKN